MSVLVPFLLQALSRVQVSEKGDTSQGLHVLQPRLDLQWGRPGSLLQEASEEPHIPSTDVWPCTRAPSAKGTVLLSDIFQISGCFYSGI